MSGTLPSWAMMCCRSSSKIRDSSDGRPKVSSIPDGSIDWTPPSTAARTCRVMRAVGQGLREGLIRDLPPTLLVFGLLGMACWLYKWYRPEGALGPAQISAFFVDLLERGYLRPSAARDGDSVLRSLRGIDRRIARLERQQARTMRTRPKPGRTR